MVDTLKSASITNLDTLGTSGGPIANSSGVGAPYISRKIADYVTPTTGGLGSTSSTYKMVRIPTNSQVKAVVLTADAALDTNGTPTLAVNVGVYYSDSTVDGTPAADQGVSISATLLGSAVLFGAAATLNVRADAGTFSAANRQLPLWQAAGLSSDPGGNFDIVVAVEATAATAASHAFQLEVEFNLPG